MILFPKRSLSDINLDNYIVLVINGLLLLWPDTLKKYVGISYGDVETTITDMTGQYSLIDRNVYDLWQDDVSVEDAIKILYEPLNTYYQASTSVM